MNKIENKDKANIDNTNFLEGSDIFLLISKYLETKGYKTAVDPFKTDINFIYSLLNKSIIKNGTEIILNGNDFQTANKLTYPGYKAILGDGLEYLSNVKGNFDVIVSFPPMGLRLDSFRLEKCSHKDIKDDYSNIVIYEYLDKLNENGECVIVVPDSFFYKKDGVYKSLEKKGIYINSVIKLYPSILSPFTQVIPNIVVLSKKKTTAIYIARYFQEDDKDSFVKNWINRITASNPELGSLVSHSEFTTVDGWFKKLKISQELSKYPYKTIALKTLVTEIKLGSHEKDIDSFIESSNSVFIPLLGNGQVVTKLSELQIKPQNYAQVILNEDKIINEYLSGFLNSTTGYKLLNASKTGLVIEKLTKAAILNIEIPLPYIDTQLELVKFNNQIRQLSYIANNLGQQLWDRPTDVSKIRNELKKITTTDDLEYLVKILPFPLASILMKYYREDTPNVKLEYLNYFFEALAELLTTILISAFYYDPEGKKILSEILSTEMDRKALKKATFGGWVNIATRLAKKYRELLSSVEQKQYVQNILKIENIDVLNSLLNKDIYIVLDDVSKKRNDWLGHSAPMSTEQSQERVELLSYNLDKIFDKLLNIFTNYILIKPRTEMTFSHGVFKIKIDKVVGSDLNFERVLLELIRPADIGRLHFYENGNEDVLTLMPFVKLMPSPRSELNSCYFYNRTEKDGSSRWLSYHFDKESEILEKDDLLNGVINNLTQED